MKPEQLDMSSFFVMLGFAIFAKKGIDLADERGVDGEGSTVPRVVSW